MSYLLGVTAYLPSLPSFLRSQQPQSLASTILDADLPKEEFSVTPPEQNSLEQVADQMHFHANEHLLHSVIGDLYEEHTAPQADLPPSASSLQAHEVSHILIPVSAEPLTSALAAEDQAPVVRKASVPDGQVTPHTPVPLPAEALPSVLAVEIQAPAVKESPIHQHSPAAAAASASSSSQTAQLVNTIAGPARAPQSNPLNRIIATPAFFSLKPSPEKLKKQFLKTLKSCLEATPDPQEQLRLLTQYLIKSPESLKAEIHYLRARCQYKLNQFDYAWTEIELSLKREETYQAKFLKTSILAYRDKNAKFSEAYCLIKELIDSIPESDRSISELCLEESRKIAELLRIHRINHEKETLLSIETCILATHFPEFLTTTINQLCSGKYPIYVYSGCLKDLCAIIEIDKQINAVNRAFALGVIHHKLRHAYQKEGASEYDIAGITTTMFDYFELPLLAEHPAAQRKLGCCYYLYQNNDGGEPGAKATAHLNKAVQLGDPLADNLLTTYKLK